MRNLLRATIVIAVPALCITVAACSDSTTSPDAGPGGQVCPTTLIQATAPADQEGTSSACHVQNYTCVVGFLCGSFVQQATCVCGNTNGKEQFSCTLNSDGTVLDTPVDDPSTLCHSTLSDGGQDTCPANTTTAEGTSCKTSGQQCFYATTCTNKPPPTDVCQCVANASGDAGLSWKCDINQCP